MINIADNEELKDYIYALQEITGRVFGKFATLIDSKFEAIEGRLKDLEETIEAHAIIFSSIEADRQYFLKQIAEIKKKIGG